MNAKRKQSDELALPAPKRKPGDGRAKRWTIMGAVILALVAGTCYMVWQEVGPHVLASGQYQVEPDQIRVTPAPPAWVRSDIKSDVIRQARLDGPLSIVDRDLTVRIAAAFAAHPWVARVDRVSKQFPSGLDVVLSYRKPAAMVEVQDGAGGLPVDAGGVLLPTKDFSAEDADEYPRIGEINSKPLGPLGATWGDPCVVGAAQIAAAGKGAVAAGTGKGSNAASNGSAERAPGWVDRIRGSANLRAYSPPALAGRADATAAAGGLQRPSWRQEDFDAEMLEASLREQHQPVSAEQAGTARQTLSPAAQAAVGSLVADHGPRARQHLAYQALGEWKPEEREAIRTLAAAAPEVRAQAFGETAESRAGFGESSEPKPTNAPSPASPPAAPGASSGTGNGGVKPRAPQDQPRPTDGGS